MLIIPLKCCFSENIKIYPVSIEIKSRHKTQSLILNDFPGTMHLKYVQIFANLYCL